MNVLDRDLPPVVQRALEVTHVDFVQPQRRPAPGRVVVATAVAVAGCLAVDAALVALGTRLFPSTSGYVHFAFTDYAKLTVIGVVIACIGWPVVARISSVPRWLYFRLAIVVSAVLLLPDVWLLLNGQPGQAVLVLVAMHLAIAVVTYNACVYLAPVSRRRVRRASPA